MGLLARRNLFHDKVRFAVTLTGIVFALVLIIIQFGLFLGFATTTSNNIDHSPVVTMADDSVLRVRLDVDESDVSKLKVGQRAYLTAEAYGDHKFWGTVIRVGGILGRKTIRTDEPSEHVDMKILETLVELDTGQRLPLGLRVDSFVERSTARDRQ